MAPIRPPLCAEANYVVVLAFRYTSITSGQWGARCRHLSAPPLSSSVGWPCPTAFTSFTLCSPTCLPPRPPHSPPTHFFLSHSDHPGLLFHPGRGGPQLPGAEVAVQAPPPCGLRDLRDWSGHPGAGRPLRQPGVHHGAPAGAGRWAGPGRGYPVCGCQRGAGAAARCAGAMSGTGWGTMVMAVVGG